jgi:hypothetical protein
MSPKIDENRLSKRLEIWRGFYRLRPYLEYHERDYKDLLARVLCELLSEERINSPNFSDLMIRLLKGELTESDVTTRLTQKVDFICNNKHYQTTHTYYSSLQNLLGYSYWNIYALIELIQRTSSNKLRVLFWELIHGSANAVDRIADFKREANVVLSKTKRPPIPLLAVSLFPALYEPDSCCLYKHTEYQRFITYLRYIKQWPSNPIERYRLCLDFALDLREIMLDRGFAYPDRGLDLIDIHNFIYTMSPESDNTDYRRELEVLARKELQFVQGKGKKGKQISSRRSGRPQPPDDPEERLARFRNIAKGREDRRARRGSGEGGDYEASEGDEHKLLKEKVINQLKKTGWRFIAYEQPFDEVLGDRADVVFRHPDGNWLVVEVKPVVGSNERTGLLQALKYKYMLAVALDLNPECVKTMLCSRSIVADVKKLAGYYGVEVMEI